MVGASVSAMAMGPWSTHIIRLHTVQSVHQSYLAQVALHWDAKAPSTQHA